MKGDAGSLVEARVPTESESRDPRRCALVLNRASGSVAEVWDDAFREKLVEALVDSGWKPELHLVSGDEIEKTVAEALERGVGAIISGGGDGTTTSIAETLRGAGVPLGILPFGTLNLAARGLGTPMEPIEAARSLKPGRIELIDVLDVNSHICLCITVLGFYPRMLLQQHEFHGNHWWMKFWHVGRGFMKTYLRSSKLRVSLKTSDGELTELGTRFIAIIPGRYVDAAGLLPERESMVSGECTVFCSRHSSRWALTKMALRFVLGKAKQDPELEEIRATSLRLDVRGKSSTLATVDGELTRLRVPIELDLVPKSLTVLKPQVDTQK